MVISANSITRDVDPRFKVFHELMPKKVRHILLVSTPYDAWIMESDCRLSEKIINEYRGLNLSHPPRLTWASSAKEALSRIAKARFDIVITMPRPGGMDMVALGRKIEQQAPRLPVITLTQRQMHALDTAAEKKPWGRSGRTFIWTGNTDILVALIKSVEDRLNVEHDCALAGIRIVMIVEDSPFYLSSILPILYKEMVTQTQNLIAEGLNEEHRLLTMRARPKILIAHTYEEAEAIYRQYTEYILGVISDVRFPRNGELDDHAGPDLLKFIKQDRWDIPLLLTSSDPANTIKAQKLASRFIDKNSPTLHAQISSFVIEKLGFGDFIFRTADGKCIDRATNLRTMEQLIPGIPDDAFCRHWNQNDFSRWMFARTEIMLGIMLRPATAKDFNYDTVMMKQYLIDNIRKMRKQQQKGVIINFDPKGFDRDAPFFKIGNGSLGGKARGLAFMSALLQMHSDLAEDTDVDIFVPQSLVITTDVFAEFVAANDLSAFSISECRDDEIADAFSRAELPEWLVGQLRAYLARIDYPIAVRSSSLQEDDQFKPYAGLYRTYMMSNDNEDIEVRLSQLLAAIKLVYASTYYKGPKEFALRVGHRTEEEKMAVLIQQVVGQSVNGFFYPTLSGVAQSYNYYPFSKMRPDDGIVTIAMGLGRPVMEGESAVRFSPVHPRILPQFSKVDDILENTQKIFYALKLDTNELAAGVEDDVAVAKRDVGDAVDEPPMQLIASTYVPAEHRIRDAFHHQGAKVVTFASILKHGMFPLPRLMQAIMEIGRVGMGCPVELEFSLNLYPDRQRTPELAVLQIRPMTEMSRGKADRIDDALISKSFCHSTQSLGTSVGDNIVDILYVRPETLDPAETVQIAAEIGHLNGALINENRKYLLVGPGRWGSADRWLGIPVRWEDISGVAAIVETYSDKLRAEPSQGSHFFHNLIALGINYMTIREHSDDHFDWQALTTLPKIEETDHMVHTRTSHPLGFKIDGVNSRAAIWIA
jgi:CheY-like chemotaxis protein